MKKIIASFSILLVITIGIVAYFNFIKKDEKEKITYLEEIIAASTQTKYLNASIPEVLVYLQNHDLKEKNDFDKMNINNDYKNCNGKVIPENGTYLVDAKCGTINDGYSTNYTLSRVVSMKHLNGFVDTGEGIVFYGISKENKRFIVGFLENNMNLKWATNVPVKTDDFIIMDFDVLNDGYVMVVANINNINNKINDYNIIKIDKNGKLIKNIKSDNLVSIYNTSGDIILAKIGEDKLSLLNKNLSTTKELNINGVKTATIEKDKIYYIDSDNNIVITDLNGNEQKKFNLDITDKDINPLIIIKNKMFIVGNQNIVTCDKNGNLIKVFNYSGLRADKNIYNGKHNETFIYSIKKVGNDIFVNSRLDQFNILDHYDSNLTLVNRNIYENAYTEIESEMWQQGIVGGESPYSLNYSDKYSRFVKINYID